MPAQTIEQADTVRTAAQLIFEPEYDFLRHEKLSHGGSSNETHTSRYLQDDSAEEVEELSDRSIIDYVGPKQLDFWREFSTADVAETAIGGPDVGFVHSLSYGGWSDTDDYLIMCSRRGSIFTFTIEAAVTGRGGDSGAMIELVKDRKEVMQINTQNCLLADEMCGCTNVYGFPDGFWLVDNHRISKFSYDWESNADALDASDRQPEVRIDSYGIHNLQVPASEQDPDDPLARGGLKFPTAIGFYDPTPAEDREIPPVNEYLPDITKAVYGQGWYTFKRYSYKQNDDVATEDLHAHRLRSPIAGNHYMFVTDTGNHRVLIFETTNNAMNFMGEFGCGGGVGDRAVRVVNSCASNVLLFFNARGRAQTPSAASLLSDLRIAGPRRC